MDVCSLCKKTFVDPVTTTSGHSYCLKCISEWFDSGKKTNPSTNENISTFLLPAIHICQLLKIQPPIIPERFNFSCKKNKKIAQIFHDPDLSNYVIIFNDNTTKQFLNFSSFRKFLNEVFFEYENDLKSFIENEENYITEINNLKKEKQNIISQTMKMEKYFKNEIENIKSNIPNVKINENYKTQIREKEIEIEKYKKEIHEKINNEKLFCLEIENYKIRITMLETDFQTKQNNLITNYNKRFEELEKEYQEKIKNEDEIIENYKTKLEQEYQDNKKIETEKISNLEQENSKLLKKISRLEKNVEINNEEHLTRDKRKHVEINDAEEPRKKNRRNPEEINKEEIKNRGLTTIESLLPLGDKSDRKILNKIIKNGKIPWQNMEFRKIYSKLKHKNNKNVLN